MHSFLPNEISGFPANQQWNGIKMQNKSQITSPLSSTMLTKSSLTKPQMHQPLSFVKNIFLFFVHKDNNKTKVMISGERQKPVQKAARWPCGVCGRSLGSNSIQCNRCHQWVHKKCSGIKGSMYKVMRSFISTGCSNPVISTGHTNVDIGASANLELVDKFCYLGDMLRVDRDADAAVEARIRIGWNKFKQLVPLLTNRDISLISRGRLYSSCERSSMLHGSETWPVRKENEVALQ